MEYVVVLILGIIIGATLITVCNIITKKSNEKQYLKEYKEIIRECYELENKNVKKKPSSKD